MKYDVVYWSNGSYEKEVIDQAENKEQALFLVKEYRLAFNSNNISFQKI